ncbi:hypothetical protein C8J57DRAFT_194280 [Mycena rebaudengoi]|nr:hypothetical protein C8J57DRAFT_194280 [Mycena rebaudengoi]
MSTYGSSSSNSARGGSSRANNNDRRPLEGSQQPTYGSLYASMPTFSGDRGSGAIGTSSLTGAMGGAHISNPRYTGAGSPDLMFNMNQASWAQTPMQPGSAGNMYFDPRTSGGLSHGETNTPGYSSPSANQHEAEIQRLYKRILELERSNERAREQLKSMGPGHSRSHSVGGIPSLPSTANFQASWQARTQARIRLLCSVNRAGNALCAWHDSRRERRAYPPRLAPEGYLNCGCTFEEALFEESLSRHQVGSYLPGDAARMDAALRNALLKLLQVRYGYKDGDFERDPRTGDWIPGEGPGLWEQRLQAGASSSRRDRNS